MKKLLTLLCTALLMLAPGCGCCKTSCKKGSCATSSCASGDCSADAAYSYRDSDDVVEAKKAPKKAKKSAQKKAGAVVEEVDFMEEKSY